MKKYAVVTFLFNHYDLLREPLVVDDNFDYYCITDDKELSSKTWKCVYVESFDTDKLTGVQKTYMAKYSFYKYIPSYYEYFFTIDGSIEVAHELTSIMKYFEEYNYELGLSMHPLRSSWVEEYKCWTASRGLDEIYVTKFKDYAERKGFDPYANNGLIECTVKIYKNIDIVKRFIDDVYNTLKKENNFEDKNEQCYFTVVFHYYDTRIKTLFFFRQLYINSKYFNAYLHGKEKRWSDQITKDKNTKILFGIRRNLKIFKPEKENLDLFIGTCKDFIPPVTDPAYKIIVGNHELSDDYKLEVIKCGNKNDALDDKFFSEIYMLKYLVDNRKLNDYVGFCHYRKYFSFMDDIPELDKIFEKSDVIIAKPYILKKVLYDHYASFHNIEDLNIIKGILKNKFPEYDESFSKTMNSKVFIPYNMVIMKRDDFIKYINFIWDVLQEYIKIVGTDIYDRINANKEKYLKGFYPNNDIDYQYRIGGYLAERLTNIFIYNNFKRAKFYKSILTEKKYNSEYGKET